jgi:AraC-type transcriptional regulator
MSCYPVPKGCHRRPAATIEHKVVNDVDTKSLGTLPTATGGIVANALGDESLGFHLAQLPDLRELGLLFYVAASSEALGDALQRAARYSSIVNEGLSRRILTSTAA